ncbi:MAG: hypothetical protein ACJAZP_003640 [Psychromonas sp.]|jgi:hypothetical protein
MKNISKSLFGFAMIIALTSASFAVESKFTTKELKN